MAKLSDFVKLHFRSESIQQQVKDVLRVAIDLEDQLAESAECGCTGAELVDILAAADMLDKTASQLTQRCRQLVDDRVVGLAAPEYA